MRRAVVVVVALERFLNVPPTCCTQENKGTPGWDALRKTLTATLRRNSPRLQEDKSVLGSASGGARHNCN